MIAWTTLLVPATTLDDEPQREALERDLHVALDRYAAEARLPPVDHDAVDISAVRETDEALAARQAEHDREAEEEGLAPMVLARLGWLCAEAPVSGPSNGPPPT